MRADPALLAGVRARLAAAGYTAERLGEVLRSERVSARAPDLAVNRRRLPAGEDFSTIAELFLLGIDVPAARAEAALAPLALAALERAGLLETDEGAVRAAVKLVPHGDLLIASDPDRSQGDDRNWVAGIHPPSTTLARLTVRRAVERTLDMGTGNGVQALLAARHSGVVVATDVNPRALAYARLNAALNGVENVELREGSFFEPVAGERFDLIVSNPPYVISPESLYAYRDSGMAGDEVSRQAVRDAPAHLVEGGLAHLLVSWAHPAGDWRSPVEAWTRGSGCDAWILHFDSEDPVSHAASWLKPLAVTDAAAFEEALDRWLSYLDAQRIERVAYGAVVLRRRRDGGWVRSEDAALALGEAGNHVLRLFANQDALERLAAPEELLADRLALVERHAVDERLVYRAGAAELRRASLAVTEGIGFEVALDEHALMLLPMLDGTRTLGEAVAGRAAALGLDEQDAARYADASLPVARRLLELGFVEVGGG